MTISTNVKGKQWFTQSVDLTVVSGSDQHVVLMKNQRYFIHYIMWCSVFIASVRRLGSFANRFPRNLND